MRDKITYILFFLFLIAAMFLLYHFGEAFRRNPIIFFTFWILTPILVVMVRFSNFNEHIKKEWIKPISITLTIITAVLSFCIFANYDKIRDYVGENCVKGYYSYRTQEFDIEDRTTTNITRYETSTLSGKIAIVGLDWLFVVLYFTIPAITYSQSKKLLA